jgi:hypothetical protein
LWLVSKADRVKHVAWIIFGGVAYLVLASAIGRRLRRIRLRDEARIEQLRTLYLDDGPPPIPLDATGWQAEQQLRAWERDHPRS